MFTNTVLSSAHSIYMNKFDKKSLEIAAQLAKNKAAVEARAKVAEELAANEKAGGGNKKKTKNGQNGQNGKSTNSGSIKALKTTAEDATELASGTGTDGEGLGDDEQNDAADDALGASANTGSGATRPRRKKRRR
jgi:hypothetical protein